MRNKHIRQDKHNKCLNHIIDNIKYLLHSKKQKTHIQISNNTYVQPKKRK